jgi:hypothetical protein
MSLQPLIRRMTTAQTHDLERSRRAVLGEAVLELATLVALAAMLLAALGAEDLVRSAELLTFAAAVSAGACAVVLARAVSARLTAGTTLRSAASAATAVAVLAFATGGFAGVVAVAGGAFVLVGSLGFALALAAPLLRDRLAAATLVAVLGALATAAPLWLGPIAERAAVGALADAIVAVTPLTFLAVLADHDYLRATWFYEHSALGTLRYDYPSAVTLCVVYTLPFAAVAALRAPYFSQSRFAKELFR